MHNEERNDEPAHDQDAEMKRLLAKLGIYSDEEVYLSREGIEAITAATTDEEKRQLAWRNLQVSNPPQSRSCLIDLTAEAVPGGNVLNPLDQADFPGANFAQQAAQRKDDEDETSESESGILKFGLLSEDEIYVEYCETAFSDSLRIKWEPVNGGREPVMSVSGAALTFLARHAALLQVFEQRFNPEMDEVLNWFSDFGTRHDLA